MQIIFFENMEMFVAVIGIRWANKDYLEYPSQNIITYFARIVHPKKRRKVTLLIIFSKALKSLL